MNHRLVCLLSLTLILVACDTDETSTSDDTTSAQDSISADSTPEDSTSGDTQPSDTGGADTTSADTASADTGGTDTTSSDTTASTDTTGAPTCTITAPTDGTEQSFREDWTFTAQAQDASGNAITGADIAWSSDVAGALGTGESLTLTADTNNNTTPLTPGGAHVITCTATDTASGLTGTDTLTVTVLSPVAEIWHPSDGETRTTGSDIPFTGRGFDIEDGELDSASMVWSSSIDGTINSGGNDQKNFSAQLSEGTNVVTLTVTDSDSNTAETSISLNMTAP